MVLHLIIKGIELREERQLREEMELREKMELKED